MFRFAPGRIRQIPEEGGLRRSADASEHAIDECVLERRGVQIATMRALDPNEQSPTLRYCRRIRGEFEGDDLTGRRA